MEACMHYDVDAICSVRLVSCAELLLRSIMLVWWYCHPTLLCALGPMYRFGAMISTMIPSIGTYETPIQFRIIQYIMMSLFNSMSSYEPNALDYFARVNVSASRRFCTGDPEFAEHRHQTLAFVILFGCRNFLPDAVPSVEGLVSSWNLDPAICSTSGACDDADTPWGYAKLLADETLAYSLNDGWNHDGSLSRSSNKIPFQDWRSNPYVPQNSPWDLESVSNWQPLLEHNGKGYLTFQEHVTPHIGQTGKSIYLGDTDICGRTCPDPDYDLEEEIDAAFATMATLDDTKKAEIETFDSKLTSLVPLQVQFYARQGINPDSWDFILADAILITSLYESVLVSWKEKVKWDGVRPPSYAHSERAGETIVSYAGPFEGTRALQAEEWEPYFRTMPHAEYPSGSSCVCAAFESAMQEITSSDDVTVALGGPLALNFSAGSSSVEPGATPQNDVLLTYSSWSSVAATCGQSRLDAGLHFRASVPAGRDLCFGIGSKVAQTMAQINAGAVPDYVVDIDSPTPAQVRCPNPPGMGMSNGMGMSGKSSSGKMGMGMGMGMGM
eukprot:m.91970 g.91970  ORF g.91970 m.91970 type:complete len:555 (-) comp16513_c0_seq14:107-1771(-)